MTEHRNPPRRPRFHDVLRSVRKKLRLSQVEIARSLDVTPRTLVRWDNGYRRPTPERLLALVTLIASMDPVAASELAVAAGTSLEELGLPGLPKAAAAGATEADAASAAAGVTGAGASLDPAAAVAFARVAVEAVVCAAADALDASPRAVRPAVLAVLRRMREAGLGVDAALAALDGGAVSS